MNQFFGTQYSQEDLQTQVQQRRRNGPLRTMSMGPPAPQENTHAVDMSNINGGGDSLDDIMQINKELQRRQSQSGSYPAQEMDRRSSMNDFDGNSSNNFNGFQFAQRNSSLEDPAIRRQSTGDLEMVSGYADMSLGLNMQGSQMGFSSTLQTAGPIDNRYECISWDVS